MISLTMFYDVCFEGEGVVFSCRRRHKDSRNLCKVMIISKKMPLEVAFNLYYFCCFRFPHLL